jgi:hypothetical protein
MDRLYFPITSDPTDPEHRAKFSYFFEFYKNGRIQAHAESMPDLPERFARWVRGDRIDTGPRVRRLQRILYSKEATRLPDVIGFEAAEEYLAKQHPEEQERKRERKHTLGGLSPQPASKHQNAIVVQGDPRVYVARLRPFIILEVAPAIARMKRAMNVCSSAPARSRKNCLIA